MTATPHPVGTRISRWGEGPFWHDEALWYVDIEGHALIRFDPSTGAENIWQMGQRIGFARPCSSGRLIWGGDLGLYFFDPLSGESQVIPGTEPESADHRYNDASVSPDGKLFAGTISLKKQTGTANLYKLDSALARTTAYAGVTNSNGIGWSPDGRHAYYIDTPTRTVLQFEYTESKLSAPQPFIDTKFMESSPDGLCVDTDGNLWVAFCHGGCVIQFDGQSGQQRQRIDFPCVETTACCFGGPELSDLYVTTGIHATKREAEAGRVFVVRGTGAQGLPGARFRDSED